jgi:4-diphosphocytidyl-2-C-methyl-D-erythritol kinase
MIRRTAHAKINLALHVTGQRDDGYHLLDSLVVFTEFGDEIFVSKPHHPHGPISITMDGPFSENLSAGSGNLITSAALMLRDSILRSGKAAAPVDIHLEKNLPIASGIGGGSADAAATLIALQEYWQSDINLVELALGLGADVPMCLASIPLRAQGIGDQISFPELKSDWHMVLINPGVSVSTPTVFSNLVQKTNPPISDQPINQMPSLEELVDLRNDLQASAIQTESVIGTVLEALENNNALLARMSGSGATCFGLFAGEDDAKQALEAISSEHPRWWYIASRLNTPS